jgi:hypothetical protein
MAEEERGNVYDGEATVGRINRDPEGDRRGKIGRLNPLPPIHGWGWE